MAKIKLREISINTALLAVFVLLCSLIKFLLDLEVGTILLYGMGSIVAAVIGFNRGSVPFWIAAYCSLFISPIIGIIWAVTAPSRERRQRESENQELLKKQNDLLRRIADHSDRKNETFT